MSTGFPVTVLTTDRVGGRRLVIARHGKSFGLTLDNVLVATCKSARSLADWGLDAGAEVVTLPKSSWSFREDDDT